MGKTIITCAVTGSLTRREQNPNLPISPSEIAASALEAADAGAAIVHLHVRNPDGTPSMRLEHYGEVVERVRQKDTGLILNLTTGVGARLQPGDPDPSVAGPRTNFVRPERRVEHVLELKPDICSVDPNTMTFGSEAVINLPEHVMRMRADRRGGRQARAGDIRLRRYRDCERPARKRRSAGGVPALRAVSPHDGTTRWMCPG